MFLDNLNEKVCKPNERKRVYCNKARLNPKPYKSPLYSATTIIVRYALPFIVGTILFTPVVGLVRVFYPWSQFSAYLNYFMDYIIEPTTMDYVFLVLSFLVAIVYYLYAFYEIGFYSLVPIAMSLITSIAMQLAGNNVEWGVTLMIISMFITIGTDLFTIKYIRGK